MGPAIVCPRGLTGHLPAGHADRPVPSSRSPLNGHGRTARASQSNPHFSDAARVPAVRRVAGRHRPRPVHGSRRRAHRRRRHREADWRLGERHARAVRRAGHPELPDQDRIVLRPGPRECGVPEQAGAELPGQRRQLPGGRHPGLRGLQRCHGGGEKRRRSVQRGRHGLAREPDLGGLRPVDGAADGDAVETAGRPVDQRDGRPDRRARHRRGARAVPASPSRSRIHRRRSPPWTGRWC